jgi:hypothetical protein
MTLDFKKLNVVSLNYNDIIRSLKNFLRSEPNLKSLDFDNDSSAISMICNILATGAAYNGVYAQFGYHESFLSTANLLESIFGLASNSSVLLEAKKSASVTNTVTVTGSTLAPYTPIQAITPDNSTIYFFNLKEVSPNTTTSLTLYSGLNLVQYTDWDFNTQSLTVPLTVDPSTISLYTTNVIGEETVWERVDKTDFNRDIGNYFTVLNTVNGYLVTAKLPESADIAADQTVYVRAITSNGVLGNNASLKLPSNLKFETFNTPTGGYDSLSVELARSKVQFSISAENRCVTLADYENAILQSGISGTDDISKITVANDTVPSRIKIFVQDLPENRKNELMIYLGTKAVAGINLIYSQ